MLGAAPRAIALNRPPAAMHTPRKPDAESDRSRSSPSVAASRIAPAAPPAACSDSATASTSIAPPRSNFPSGRRTSLPGEKRDSPFLD